MSASPSLMRTKDPIPLVSSLSDIYSSQSSVLSQGPRWDKLTQTFSSHFGSPPSFIARAPGRVNIIGEHIDHMGFGVLPAALELDILMAVRVVPDSQNAHGKTIEFDLRNTTKRFEPCVFSSGVESTDDVKLLHQGATRWANYFKVAWKGLHPHLPSSLLSSSAVPSNSKIQVLVDGTIPPESSLSSSAAMTVCSSIVILQALSARPYISRTEMANVAIDSERLVGVASGGMDQSASIFGERNTALHITFYPSLNIDRVALPQTKEDCTFIIANSLLVSDKKVMGPVQYNLRVVELLLAARVFCKANDLPRDDTTRTWRKLMEVYYQRNPLPMADEEVDRIRKELGEEAAQIYHMSTLVAKQLPQGLQSRELLEKLTGYEGPAFHDEFLSQFEIRAPDGFELSRRTRHVFAESFRVLQFRAQCLGPNTLEKDDVYTSLGRLMNASHSSLSADYENSIPELESIISIARAAGSLGSRLTGAGWGGSTVHLVPRAKVQGVLQALREEYYGPRGFYGSRMDHGKGLNEREIAEALLESQPAGGACVYQVD